MQKISMLGSGFIGRFYTDSFMDIGIKIKLYQFTQEG